MAKVSVIIPTYNRADSIRDTLACLKQQKMGDGISCEVIVVDNNSNDQTKKVVRSCFPLFSRQFKYCFEPKQGRTFALNLGIKASSGEIITCLDDDCLVKTDYIARIHSTFQEAGQDVGFIGGKILPHWVGERHPQWLDEFLPGDPGRSKNWDGTNEFFCGPLGILDYGDKSFLLERAPNGEFPKLFYGANISFRRAVLESFGYFSSDSVLVEDTEMCLRLLSSGVKALYAPQVIVFHKIKTAGITPDYYYHWYFTKGMRREIVQKIDEVFTAESWVMFHKSYSQPMKEMLLNRCQALFNFGQMIKSWTPHDGKGGK